MKTLTLDGVKYKLVPLHSSCAPQTKEHSRFIEILEASQRRSLGDPAWTMTDEEWRAHWGVKKSASSVATEAQKKAWATRRGRYGPTGRKAAPPGLGEVSP